MYVYTERDYVRGSLTSQSSHQHDGSMDTMSPTMKVWSIMNTILVTTISLDHDALRTDPESNFHERCVSITVTATWMHDHDIEHDSINCDHDTIAIDHCKWTMDARSWHDAPHETTITSQIYRYDTSIEPPWRDDQIDANTNSSWPDDWTRNDLSKAAKNSRVTLPISMA